MDIKKEILSVKEEFNLNNVLIEPDDSFQIVWNKAVQKFSKTNYRYPLWDNFNSFEDIYDPEGWIEICNLLTDYSFYFCTEKRDCELLLKFDSSSDLFILLENCFGFVFYIIDMDFNFILCFNDHDIVVASGIAESWLQS